MKQKHRVILTVLCILKLTKTLFLLLAIATMTSCTNPEDQLKGGITLTVDWSERTAGVDIPASYTVMVNHQMLNYTQATNSLSGLNAGTYPIHIYNTPEKISIDGTTATVASSNNLVDPLPGWLFTAVREVVYADFKVEDITVVMQQQIRQLTITLKPEGSTIDRIASITANLSGIAGAWDFKGNQPVGSPLSVPLVFTKQDDGTWLTIVRLLGITGTQQRLTGTVSFIDGSPDAIPLESDLSASLSDFNRDKKTPLSLQGEMKETPTEYGFTGSITSWESGNGESGNAE